MVKTFFPIVDEPALLVAFPDKRILCITDLHLGYEFLLAQKGVSIPPQAVEMKIKILNLIEQTNADQLVLIGDIKHNIFRIPLSEWRGVAKLLEAVSKKIDVQITLGNHDVNLDLLLSRDIHLYSSKGFLIEESNIRLGFIHGHAWPGPDLLQADYIFMGHNHPVIEMRDELGGKWFEPAWLELHWNREKIASSFAKYISLREISNPIDDLKNMSIQIGNPKIIVMPAFNPLLGGVAINRPEMNFLGPLLSSGVVEKNTAKVKMLDGTYLGSLENCSRLVRQEQ
ncbi:MAG: metallophosphoesterase [Candidatus Jordarchaeum sp.]|uniref:metallophosphoesterase n=1 Tax=Candidatus Jordarchaeum sp. TaxID=2823881 RepID=UPI00404A8B54